MPKYIVNKNAQDNGDHEVHVLNTLDMCNHLPDPNNMVDLGMHPTCTSAVLKAKSLGYRTADGCYYCANACHTR